MHSLTQSVVRTLTYSDYFNYPLTFTELHARLISHKASPSVLRRTLQRLLSSGTIAFTDEYYHLPARAKLVTERARRTRLAPPKLARAQTLANRLSHCPGVMAMFLTGSLAVNNAGINDDIDFMIITKSDQLWTTRLILTLYTSLFGLRRTPRSQKPANRLCLNLYLEPRSFLLPASRRSLYTAYELIQALPLYDPFNTRSHLLASNPWIKDFLPNFHSEKTLNVTHQSEVGSPIRFIEAIAYRLQRFYMKKKITRELITPTSAFFHPHDPARKILLKLAL